MRADDPIVFGTIGAVTSFLRSGMTRRVVLWDSFELVIEFCYIEAVFAVLLY